MHQEHKHKGKIGNLTAIYSSSFKRNIDFRTGVLATSVKAGIPGVKPVEIELTDFNTKEKVDVMEVDACLIATGRVPFTQGLGLDKIGAETDRRGE